MDMWSSFVQTSKFHTKFLQSVAICKVYKNYPVSNNAVFVLWHVLVYPIESQRDGGERICL